MFMNIKQQYHNSSLYKSLLIIGLFYISSTTLFCQNKIDAIKNRFEYNMLVLRSYPYQLEDINENWNIDTFDPDSLVRIIKDDVIEMLKLGGIDALNTDDEYDLVFTTPDSAFSVVDISYHSGGTAGIISHSIIIKHEKSGIRIFDLTHIESSIFEFHQLQDDIYLCLASISKESAWCYNQAVFVVNFKEEAKLLSAFNENWYYAICNADITFDEDTKILSITTEETLNYGKGCDEFFKMVKDVFAIEACESDDNRLSASIKTRFDGEKFVKP